VPRRARSADPPDHDARPVPGVALAAVPFASITAAWLWLLLKLYMVSVFLPAGWEKITSGKLLFGDGSLILGLDNGAIASKDTPARYAWFLRTSPCRTRGSSLT
jgi:hypothetical protein